MTPLSLSTSRCAPAAALQAAPQAAASSRASSQSGFRVQAQANNTPRPFSWGLNPVALPQSQSLRASSSSGQSRRSPVGIPAVAAVAAQFAQFAATFQGTSSPNVEASIPSAPHACPASEPRQPAESYGSYGSYGHTVIRRLGTTPPGCATCQPGAPPARHRSLHPAAPPARHPAPPKVGTRNSDFAFFFCPKNPSPGQRRRSVSDAILAAPLTECVFSPLLALPSILRWAQGCPCQSCAQQDCPCQSCVDNRIAPRNPAWTTGLSPGKLRMRCRKYGISPTKLRKRPAI